METRPRGPRRPRRAIALLAVTALGVLGVSCDDESSVTEPASETMSAPTTSSASSVPSTEVSAEVSSTTPEVASTTPVDTTTEPTTSPEAAPITVYGTDDGLPDAELIAVEIAPDGTVWGRAPSATGSTDGSRWARLDDGRFVEIPTSEEALGFLHAAGLGGVLWMFGPAGFDIAQGVQYFDGTTWSYDPEAKISSAAVGPDGTLYGFDVTPDPGAPSPVPFAAFDGASWTELPAPPRAAAAGSRDPAAAPDGSVWVRTERGLAWFDGESWTTTDDLGPDVVEAFSHVGAGEFRLGADGTAWMLYLDDELGPAWLRLADGMVERRAIDLAGLPFVDDCDVPGAGRLPLPTDPSNAAMAVAPLIAGFGGDTEGHLWTAITCLGVTSTDPATGEPRIFTLADGLPTLGFEDLATHPDGSVWVATDSGLVRIAPGS